MGSHITITRMLVVLFLLPALTAAVPSPHPCRLVDAIPFFNFDKERSSIEDNNDLTVLTEFARFMNHKVPAMLEEFAHLKNILNVGPVENFQPGKDQTAANLRLRLRSLSLLSGPWCARLYGTPMIQRSAGPR